MIKKLIGENYPKTSCECVECPMGENLATWPVKNTTPLEDTNNLGLERCDQVTDISQCQSTSYVSSSKQPEPWKKGDPYQILNPNFGLDDAPGFFTTEDSKCDCPEGPKNTVTAFDPRLIYTLRGNDTQQLDRAPYTGNVQLKNIYDDFLTNYGMGYKNYKTVNGGQIMYYLDEDLDMPYFLPVSTVRSDVNTEVFQTPMGGLWPRYPKCPLTKDSRYISPQQFTRDTVTHREDLMSLQAARFNREKYPLDIRK